VLQVALGQILQALRASPVLQQAIVLLIFLSNVLMVHALQLNIHVHLVPSVVQIRLSNVLILPVLLLRTHAQSLIAQLLVL